MKKLLMVAALATGAIAANAQSTLWDQTQATGGKTETGGAFLSQNITDNTGQSTYLFDNITVGGPGWLVNKITVIGDEGGQANQTQNLHVRFSQNANFTTPGTNFQFNKAGFSGLSGGILNLGVATTGDPGALGITLAPGAWFVCVWIDRPFLTGGQWNVKTVTPLTGGEAIAHNPGGALLGTTAPGTISSLAGSNPADLEFRIEGEAVPEPATMLAIGAGLAALALRRRK